MNSYIIRNGSVVFKYLYQQLNTEYIYIYECFLILQDKEISFPSSWAAEVILSLFFLWRSWLLYLFISNCKRNWRFCPTGARTLPGN